MVSALLKVLKSPLHLPSAAWAESGILECFDETVCYQQCSWHNDYAVRDVDLTRAFKVHCRLALRALIFCLLLSSTLQSGGLGGGGGFGSLLGTLESNVLANPCHDVVDRECVSGDLVPTKIDCSQNTGAYDVYDQY